MTTATPLLNVLAMSNFYWVENETQGRNFPTAYNNSVIFLDKNQDKMYIKSVDGAGVMTSFRKFKIEEEFDAVAGAVSQEDFNALKEELNSIKEQMNKRQQHNTPYKKNRKERYDGE